MSIQLSIHPEEPEDSLSVEVINWGDSYLSVNIKFGSSKITIYPKDEEAIEAQLHSVLAALSRVVVRTETL